MQMSVSRVGTPIRSLMTRPFRAQASMQRSRQPTHLVLDFDGTLTNRDTMEVLGCLPKAPRMTWQQIVDAYMRDYRHFQQTTFPWKRHDRQEYSQWLLSRAEIETRSAQRVQDAGFFGRVSVQDVDHVIDEGFSNGKLSLREGWSEMFDLVIGDSNSNAEISILSVNWSETFIRRALYRGATLSKSPRKESLCRYINDMPIYANEIEGLASPEGSSGRVCRPFREMDIRTSMDKARYLQRVIVRHGSNQFRNFMLYVGDSTTDFDALCEADLGIWLCAASGAEYPHIFKQAFSPLDFMPPPIGSWKEDGGRALFYWAPDFETIIRALKDTSFP